MNAEQDGLEDGSWRFPYCPEPPAWHLDWAALLERFGWLRNLAGCPQDPIYHAEGDVLVHTQMVCETLVSLPGWRRLLPGARSVLFAAALLHDVGKPSCTMLEPDGRISSRGHPHAGARIARRVLYMEDPFLAYPVPFATREAIVALVRHHGLPPYLLDRADPRRAVILAGQTARCDWLALLAEADVRGRKGSGIGELLDRVALFTDYAREQRCLSAPRVFASDLSRFVYFRKERGDPDYLAFDASRCEVVLLSGLPGAGKDTYAREGLAGLPLISLDALRAELGVGYRGDQGGVIDAARGRARAHLRAGQGFAWNATNITRHMRERLVDLFVAYDARVRIVYLEVPYADLLRRNRERHAPLPVAVLERLARSLEVPDCTEAHQVHFQLAPNLLGA